MRILRRVFYLAVFSILIVLWASEGFAEPKAQVQLSGNRIPLDDTWSVTVYMTSPSSEGQYRVLEKSWKLDNLVFDKESVSESTEIQDGKKVIRKALQYSFKPEEKGVASISNISLGYINLKTQKTGRITLRRTIKIEIVAAKQSGIMILIMAVGIIVILGLAAGALFLFNKASSGPDLKQIKKDKEAYLNVISKIQSAQGDIKTQAYEWDEQFKRFLTLHYQLPSGMMTESDIKSALEAKTMGKSDREMLNRLFERLADAKFGTKVTQPEIIKKLQADLIHFIEGKQSLGGPPA